MRRAPLVPLALATIVGIITANTVSGIPTIAWLALLCSAAIIGSILLIFRKEYPTTFFSILLIAAFFALGGIRSGMGNPQLDTQHWSRHCSAPSFLSLRLTESPVPRAKSWRTNADVESVDGIETHGSLRLYLRKDSTAATLRYGDRLLVHGYADTARGSLYSTSDHYLLTGRDSTSLRSRCETLRMKLLRRMQAGPLERRYRGIAEAMTAGWRGDLEEDIQGQFRDAGIMHLLCVSGLHVGLLAAMVGWVLRWLGRERRGRILRGTIQLIVIWAFAALTGLAPATVRAALMFSLFIVSNIMNRRTDTMNLLAAAAIVMLYSDPMLLFDIGWQLSFSAVTGILLARPVIGLQRNFLWQASMVSLAATLATLPVTLATFHRFYPYFLIANVIIVPLASLILALSLSYMLIPCCLTACPLRFALQGCDWLTQGIAGLPGASIEGLNPGPVATILVATAILFLFLIVNRRARRW